MRALVTGGAGFIGSHVVRALLADGHAVRVLVLPGSDLRNLAGLPVEQVPGDVTQRAQVRAAVAGCGWVFHLAALFEIGSLDPARMQRVNVEGTRIVLEEAGAAGARVVHTSSIAAFGGQGLTRDATEDSAFALGPSGDPYARSKYDAHRVALELARGGVDVRVVCPTGPLGPGDLGPTPTGRALVAALTLPLAPVLDTLSNVGDVRDMARGHVLAMQRGPAGEVYLLGNRNAHMSELVHLALEVAGQRKPVVWLPDRLAGLVARAEPRLARLRGRPPLLTPEVLRITRLGLRASCAKAFRELELPRRPLRESVADAVAWFAREGYLGRRRLGA